MILKPDLAGLAKLCGPHDYPRYPGAAGVRLKLDDKEYLCAEATDGRRLVRLRIPTDSAGAFPVNVPVIVAARDWKRLCNLADPKGPGGQEVRLSLVVDEHNLTLTGTTPCGKTLRIPYGREQSKFPDVERVIPKKEPLFRVQVDALLLAELLTAIAPFGPGEENANRVEIEFYADNHPFRITASNDEGAKVEGLIVPLESRK
jgi:DNA polymerase III sliding clamp (beta) subunit (PCNA family)